MKPLFLLIASSLLLTGCCSLELADINPANAPNAQLIPYVTPVLDQNNIQRTYTSGTTTTTGRQNSLWGSVGGAVGSVVASSFGVGRAYSLASTIGAQTVGSKSDTTFNSDKRVEDVANIFLKEVNDNIADLSTAKNGKGYGTIALDINAAVCGEGSVWPVVSKLTLGTLNLFGMPYSYRSEQIDVSVCIYDAKGDLIKRYVTSAGDKVWVALYYGYDDDEALRLAAASALKQALAAIRQRIGIDAPEIAARLK